MIILASKVLPITRPDIIRGGLVITGSKIIDIGSRSKLLKKYPGEKVVDLGNRIVMPGLVNLHTHLDLSHMHGLVDECDDFFGWIMQLVELKRKLGTKGARTTAAKALAEAISTGTTCIGDIAGTDTAIPALKRSGVRGVIFIEALGLDERTAKAAYTNLAQRVMALKGLPDRLRAGISPHSTYSVSRSLYNKINNITSSNRYSIAVHVSETIDEHNYISGKPSGIDAYHKKFGWDGLKRNSGKTPIEFLKGLNLHNGLLAVHGVHLTKGDMAILKRSGASVAHCPRSNHMLRVGKAPVEELLAKGINVGIGTDSLASNTDLNLWEEMRFAYLVNRLTARQVLEMATINGAKALGLGDVAGSLEPNKEADLIAINPRHFKNNGTCKDIVTLTGTEDIDLVMVQGRLLHISKELKGRHGF